MHGTLPQRCEFTRRAYLPHDVLIGHIVFQFQVGEEALQQLRVLVLEEGELIEERCIECQYHLKDVGTSARWFMYPNKMLSKWLDS
jgi:hypothetical protein